jgi:hypothetical protein
VYRLLPVLLVLVGFGGAAAVSAADVAFPNDPDFGSCANKDVTSGCAGSGQWDLYGPLSGNCDNGLPRPDGGLPCWAPLARDPQHAAGVNMTGAWAQGNVGRADILVAYIEGGVNYDSNNIKDGLDNIYLNQKELPLPEKADGSTASAYDANGDGRFDIRDYAQDPRVNPKCPDGTQPFVKFEEGTTRSCEAAGQHDYLNHVDIGDQKKVPYLSPEDLIVVFSDHTDADHNGYVDDISGWNFDRNTNDPQTEDTAYSHAPGLISLIGGQADNKFAGVGVCRECRVVPIKQGSECLGRPDRWGAAILYATDLGATTISSVVVSYAYSSFNQRAIDYAYAHNVALALDSNDFDAMDHTDGMLWNHVIPGNSLDIDQDGLKPEATTTFRARSNTTSYGTHNVFSGEEVSTSGATPFMASMLGMVQSAGLNAVDKKVIPAPLTPDEVKQIMMDTASPVVPQTQSPATPRQWPGNPSSNWSTQYGYGRPDIGAATKMVMEGKIPPTAEIDSPRWFTYVDPTRTKTLKVDGALAPSRVNSGGSAHWVLEWAPGADPADSAFKTIAQGDGAKRGVLGTFDLSQIPQSFYDHAPQGSLQPDAAEQYTLTLRLRVKDSNGLLAEDRRSIGVRHDPQLLGKPRRIGAELSGAPTYADLEGRHELDLVFSTYDGVVHALRPSGHEVRGFPVHSSLLRSFDKAEPEAFAAPAYVHNRFFRDQRDPLAGVAVGDLLGNGSLDVVASGMNGRIYAWNPRGRALRGFPKMMDTPSDQHAVPTPRSPTPHSRDPQRGAWAQPVLAPLEGGRRLDAILPGWDGKVYAWRPDGHRVPGWPVEIKLPQADFARDGVDPSVFIHDPKLMYSVAVGDVLKKGRPQVFVSSFDCSGKSVGTATTATNLAGGGGATTAKAWLYGVWADGTKHAGGAYLPNWPVAMSGLAFCYDQSIDFVGEGATPPLIASIGGAPRIVSSAPTGQPQAFNGDGSVYQSLDLSCSSAPCSANPPYRPTGDTHTITLTGQGGFGDLTGGGAPDYIQSSTGIESILSALSVNGQASVPQVYEKDWDVSSGKVRSGWPVRQDGFPFYDAPIAAPVATGGGRQAIEANDNYWIHAWNADGSEAAGFPKYTGQWVGFVGAVGDPKLDGKERLVYGTREGELFQWSVPGDAKANTSWWHYRHDERLTGDYATDSRRPAQVTGLRVTRSRGTITLRFTAPGDDWNIGTAKRYELLWPGNGGMVLRAHPKPAGSREVIRVRMRRTVRSLSVRAIDDAGNIGARSAVARVR